MGKSPYDWSFVQLPPRAGCDFSCKSCQENNDPKMIAFSAVLLVCAVSHIACASPNGAFTPLTNGIYTTGRKQFPETQVNFVADQSCRNFSTIGVEKSWKPAGILGLTKFDLALGLPQLAGAAAVRSAFDPNKEERQNIVWMSPVTAGVRASSRAATMSTISTTRRSRHT